jgi:hypothetical protein
MNMDLLHEELPELSLTIDAPVETFFDHCETLATMYRWRIYRQRHNDGSIHDRIDLHLTDDDPGYPTLRMVADPGKPHRLKLDVIDSWNAHPVEYDEYLSIAHESFAILFAAYQDTHNRRLRLGVPKRAPRFDMNAVDCNQIRYAAEKFCDLERSLATGEGDARVRLINAFSIFHVIQPDDLPQPLDKHLEWVYRSINRRPARHRMEGSVEATLRTMRNSTAADILGRVLDIADAISKVEKMCEDRVATG